MFDHNFEDVRHKPKNKESFEQVMFRRNEMKMEKNFKLFYFIIISLDIIFISILNFTQFKKAAIIWVSILYSSIALALLVLFS